MPPLEAAFLTRFAPSPTGLLHLGHAYSALTTWRAAQEANGRFLLRIEDIDHTRCRPEYETAIYEDLAWLGLRWEQPVRRQSDHFEDYATAIDRLRAIGVLYRCFRTHREIAEASASAPHAKDDAPVYFGPDQPHSADEEASLLESGKPFAWRLSIRYSQELLGEEFARLMFKEIRSGSNAEHVIVRAHPEFCGDVILARKDTPASYHLCVVHDDALQGVTHVIRGEDLRPSVHIHVLLQRLLGYPTPVYQHHPLLVGEDGKRYAKRDRSLTLASLRTQGWSAREVVDRVFAGA